MKRYLELGLIVLAAFGAVLVMTVIAAQLMPTVEQIEPAAKVLLEMGSKSL